MSSTQPEPRSNDVPTPVLGHMRDDVLRPWGDAGPAPVGSWRTDILGANFESRTLPLLPDEEGDCVATLVRYCPPWDPEVNASPYRFVLLSLHGRNDYFFHAHVAETIAEAGGAFYALDLRKYGRSLRPGQTIGYIDDLSTYDEDIAEALNVIREDVGSLPLILMGHSTGGLLATVWAHRHPSVLSGLILNSAWLEMHTMVSMRPAAQQLLGRIASYNPLWEVPSGSDTGFYSRSLLEGWAGSDLDIPDRLRPYVDDPAITGWKYAREWKRPESYPVFAGWLEAVMEGHRVVERSTDIDCPILSFVSTSTYFDDQWSPKVFSSDIVLDVDVIAERSRRLGNHVTIARFPARHDVFLSDPDVRHNILDTLRRWLTAFV